VPFQYSPYLRQHLAGGAFVQSARASGDRPGRQRLYDLTGSYGVNLFGYDFYKACIAEAASAWPPLGPVLGAYHPCVLDNVERLRAISGLDEVSFHMSGTEAVMQAVRLARYHTGARTWCASAAPTTAGGRTCSPAPATRCRRARPTR
jgi:glutamate-1-semialdehyde 2,1-aminomutase